MRLQTLRRWNDEKAERAKMQKKKINKSIDCKAGVER